MAIETPPDGILCGAVWRHDRQAPPAVAALLNPPSIRPWRCQECIERYRVDDNPVPYLVVYLDPARQRRPGPDRPATHDDGGWPLPHGHDRTYPDPAP